MPEPTAHERLGPFGPGGRAPGPKDAAAPPDGVEGGPPPAADEAELPREPEKPAAFSDPAFRGLFEGLKKAVEGKE